MMGNLFIVRNVSPDVIDNMTVRDMHYWNDWHIISEEYQKDQTKKQKQST